MIDYGGNNVYPATVTIVEDGEETDAASYAVALEQLADRTAFLNALITGGEDLSFTDATFHGTTNLADGTLSGTVSTVAVIASGAVALQGLAVALTATGDMSLSADDDLTLTVGDGLVVTCAAFDFNGGRFLMDATHFELADDTYLGGGTGDLIEVRGTFATLHNATFPAGKTVDLDGATNVGGVLAIETGGAFEVQAGATGLISGAMALDGTFNAHTGAVVTIEQGARLELQGNVEWRPAVILTDHTHSVGVRTGTSVAPNGADTLKVPPSVLTVDRDFIVRSAWARAGNRMRFYSDDNAHYLFIKQDDGTGIAQLQAGAGTGRWRWIELEHTGNANGWHIIGGQYQF